MIVRTITCMSFLTAVALGILVSTDWIDPPLARCGGEEVYVRPGDAPRLLFPEGTSIEKRTVALTPELRGAMARLIAPTQPSLWEGAIPVYIVSTGSTVIGYAVVVNEIGKHRPITFVVGVTPDEKVSGIEIMVYREPKGGEVRMKGFLKQYQGKDLGQPILAGRDIASISGATLSVRAVNRGAKKALALVHFVYGPPRTARAPGGIRVP